MTVYLADRHDAQIEDLPVWSMCFHFDAADFVAFQAVEKRVVDRWIPCQFGEALRFEPRDGGTEEFVRGRIRGDEAHVFVDDEKALAHARGCCFELCGGGEEFVRLVRLLSAAHL